MVRGIVLKLYNNVEKHVVDMDIILILILVKFIETSIYTLLLKEIILFYYNNYFKFILKKLKKL